MIKTMMSENIDQYLENQSLKKEFEIRNLDLSQVFCPTPDDLRRENRILTRLLDWVQVYSECHSRREMEEKGYDFPPIEPDFSPDNDWRRFELWLQGKPIRTKLKDQIAPGFTPIPAEKLTDEELQQECRKLIERLAAIHVLVNVYDGVPPLLLYEYILESLEEEFDIIMEGHLHLNGCSGCCPACFQRPWCEIGSASCWPEDEEANEMFLIEPVKKYVSSSPVSIQILKRLQLEEDKNPIF